MKRRTGRYGLLAAVLLLCLSQTAWSQTRGIHLENDDLSVHVDVGWPGGGKGGYYPLRFRIVNLGETRTVTIQIKPQVRDTTPTVKRTKEAVQNETAFLTLSVPLVGNGYRATLEVLDENGKPIDGLQRDLAIPQAEMGEQKSPSILIISEAVIRMQGLEQFAAIRGQQSQQRQRRRRRVSSGTISIDATYLPPRGLSESWIDYTSVDLIFADLLTLDRIKKTQRAALKQWVQCGGTLVVYNVGSDAKNSTELDRLLELKSHAALSETWQPAAVELRGESRRLLSAEELNPVYQSTPPPSRIVLPNNPRQPIRLSYRWSGTRNPFSQRRLMWGKIVAFRDDPFNGTPADWAWLFHSLGKQHYSWETRYGFSARGEAKKEFLKFLIPGVTGVPTYSFLFLITAFTILIGPVNYLVLWKRKRLFFLILTVPIIAFVTSLALFGYSMVSHGFTVKTRIRSMTVVDQRSHESVTMARVAMFAGIPPSEGLQFSTSTAVFPIWGTDNTFEAGTVDWTDGQTLSEGWLRARTRTQFFTVQHRRERGRLEIDPPKDGKLKVTNGFPWKIEALLLADRSGRLYIGPEVPAGESVELTPAKSSDFQTIDRLLARYPMELPDGVTESSIQNSRPTFRRPGRRYRNYGIPTAQYGTNLMEAMITRLRKLQVDQSALGPNSYLAILAENPDVDLGVTGANEYDGYHLLLGHY